MHDARHTSSRLCAAWLLVFWAQACGDDGSERGSSTGGAGTRGAGTGAAVDAGIGGSTAPAPRAGAGSPNGSAGAGRGGSGGSGGRAGNTAPLPDAGTPVPTGSLSERYPGDVGIAADPSVLFHDDFESGWGRWDAPTADTQYLQLVSDAAPRARAPVICSPP